MSKFLNAFDEEQTSARAARLAAREKEAARRDSLTPLLELVLPILKSAVAELASKGVELDMNPKLQGLQDVGMKYLMFRLKTSNLARATSVYRFSLADSGKVVASRCDAALGYRNSDQEILTATIETIKAEDIDAVVIDAVRELARNEKDATQQPSLSLRREGH
jgi:hypothetical protein